MCALLENMKCGVSVGEKCIKELRYTDYTVLITVLGRNNRNVEKVVKESAKLGLN